jgi:hypothetical protein
MTFFMQNVFTQVNSSTLHEWTKTENANQFSISFEISKYSGSGQGDVKYTITFEELEFVKGYYRKTLLENRYST